MPSESDGAQTLNPALRLLNEDSIARERRRVEELANADDAELVANGEADRVELRLHYDVGGRVDEGDLDSALETLHFDGGVSVRAAVDGPADLVGKVVHELGHAQDDWHDRLNNSDGAGGMLTSHHQQAALEAYPEPLNMLASALIASNEKVWLHGAKKRTVGAETVREHGLTSNQRYWVEQIAEAMRDE